MRNFWGITIQQEPGIVHKQHTWPEEVVSCARALVAKLCVGIRAMASGITGAVGPDSKKQPGMVTISVLFNLPK